MLLLYYTLLLLGFELAMIISAAQSSISTDQGLGRSCAITINKQVKCWGNDGIQPLINLGTGRTAVAISGGSTMCVILDNGQLKCRGTNNAGQLGQGHTSNIGVGPNEMGDNLPPINLGTGRTALAVSVGFSHTCAILNNGQLKCWGLNTGGLLGQNHTSNIGDGPNEMGDNLPPISLGIGRTAVAVSVDFSHTCAILDNGQLKCWGDNQYGKLGQGHTSNIGDGPNEMGDNLPPINLGTGRTCVAVSASTVNTCALLDNGQLKCWGLKTFTDLFNTNSVGDAPNEMGDMLPPINLGTGRLVVELSTTIGCARLDNRAVKCFRLVNAGVLDYGDNLPAVQVNDCLTLKCNSTATSCLDRYPINDNICKCQPGNFYDPVTLRDLLSPNDFDASGRPIRQCRPVDVSLRVSNRAVEFKVNTSPDKNTSVAIGLTNGQLNPLLFGPSFPIPYDGIIPGNKTQLVSLQEPRTYKYNGQEFYVIVKSISTNVTIVSERFILPCGCDAESFFDYPPVFPRPDDGRPTPGVIIQDLVNIYLSWTDHSVCATQFSLHRIIPSEGLLELIVDKTDDFESKNFARSNAIQTAVIEKMPGLDVKALVSDFVLDSTTCNQVFEPNDPMDNTIQSGLPPGTPVIYCMTASNPSLNFVSGYACTSRLMTKTEARQANASTPTYAPSSSLSLLRRRLEAGTSSNLEKTVFTANLPVKIVTGNALSSIPEPDVQLKYEVWDITLTRKVLLHSYEEKSSNAFGETELRIEAKLSDNDWLSTESALLVKVIPYKFFVPETNYTSVPSQNPTRQPTKTGPTLNPTTASPVFGPPGVPKGKLAHEFTCESKNCAETFATVVDCTKSTRVPTYNIQDTSAVFISGFVRIYDTPCPLKDAEICAWSHPYDPALSDTSVDPSSMATSGQPSKKFGCVKSAADGSYTITLPRKVKIQLVAMLNGEGGAKRQLKTTYGLPIEVNQHDIFGVDFFDDETRVLFVEVYGGECKVPLAQTINIEINRVDNNCIGWSTTYTDLTAGATLSPVAATQLPTQSPVIMPPTFDAPTKSPTATLAPVTTRSPTKLPSIAMPPASTPAMLPTASPFTLVPTMPDPTFPPTVDASLSRPPPTPASNGVVRFRVVVPAARLEVKVTKLGMPRTVPQSDDIVQYLEETYKGDTKNMVDLTFANRTTSAEDEARAAGDEVRIVRFQVDVKPALDLQIAQQVNGAFKRVDFPYEDCGSSHKKVMLRKTDEKATVYITAVQDFFGQTCHVVRGSLLFRDGLWEEAKGVTNACGNQFCEYPFEDQGWPGGNVDLSLSFASIETNPRPKKTFPHIRVVEAQFVNTRGEQAGLAYQWNVLVMGKTINDNALNQLNVVYLDPVLLTVVRDPPGDASTQTYKNVETTVVVQSTAYEVYDGPMDDLHAGLNFEFEVEACLFFCATTAKVKTDIGYEKAQTVAEMNPNSHKGSHEITRTFTWTYTSPSLLISALREEMKGSDSDMFLVLSQSVLLFNTRFVIQDETNADHKCKGWHEDKPTYMDVDQVMRMRPNDFIGANVPKNPRTVQWISRDFIERNLDKAPTALERAKWQKILDDANQAMPEPHHEYHDIPAEDIMDFFLRFGFAQEEANTLLESGQLAPIVAFLRESSYSTGRLVLSKAWDDLLENEKMKSLKARVDKVLAIVKKFGESAKARLGSRLTTYFAKLGSLARFLAPVASIGMLAAEIGLASNHMVKVQDGKLSGGDLGSQFALQKELNRTIASARLFKSMLNPNFKPLPTMSMGLWDDQNVLQNFDFNAESTLISFSGGGSVIEFTMANQDNSAANTFMSGGSTEVGQGLGGESGFSPGVMSKGSWKYVVSTNLKQQNEKQFHRETSATVSFSDSTIGDHFLVQVFRDARFGTFVFNTLGGASRCPYEKGTEARETPKLSTRLAPPVLVHPRKPAVFHLYMENEGIDPTSFNFLVDAKEFDDSPKILVDGMPMDKLITFHTIKGGGYSYPIMMEVHRGLEKYEYDLQFSLQSICEMFRIHKSEPYPVRFARECPEVEIIGEFAKGTVFLTGNLQTVDIQVRNKHAKMWNELRQYNLQGVHLQYRRWEGDDWNTIKVNEVDVDLTSNEGALTRTATYSWDVANLGFVDQLVQVRAVTKCHPGGPLLLAENEDLYEQASQIGLLRVDRNAPMIFSVHPSLPFPGVDEIAVEFTEPILCGPTWPFSLRMNLTEIPATHPLANVMLSPQYKTLLVVCEGRKISISIPATIPAIHLLNVKATVTLENVHDLAGNEAKLGFNTIAAPLTFSFQFANVDLVSAQFSIRRLVVPAPIMGGCTGTNFANIQQRISEVTALNKDLLSVIRAEQVSVVCLADFVVSGTLVAWTGFVNGRRLSGVEEKLSLPAYFDRLLIEGMIEYDDGGGLDVVPPKPSVVNLESEVKSIKSILVDVFALNGTGAAFNASDLEGNCSLAFSQLLTVKVLSQVNLIHADAEDFKNEIKLDVGGVKSDVNEIKDEIQQLKTLLLIIANQTASAIQQQAENDPSIAISNENSFSTTAVVGFSVGVAFATLAVVLTVMSVTRMWKERGERAALERVQRRTGDLAVVGSMKDLTLTTQPYNAAMSPHPMFSFQSSDEV